MDGLYWVPGNGKLINIWEDTVLGKIPPHLPRLQQRMEALGMKTIWDISTWENLGKHRWTGWKISEILDEFDEEKTQLIDHLAGIAPISQNRRDNRGWGDHTGKYSTSEGYQRFSANFNVPANPRIWNYNWNNNSLPKIDLFIWTLLHERILTGENLERRGIDGPFRCPLCAAEGETTTHLFLKCSYANSVWKDALECWGGIKRMPVSIHDCFYNWEIFYQGELSEKRGVRTCWGVIPKIIC